MPDVKTIKKINYNGTEYLISGLATTSEDGLMSSGDKAKLDGLGGATVTGVKGNAETTYRTGDVNITPANIGLGNVENKSSATIRSELTSNNVTSALGYTPATQNVATTSSDGLMSADDKGKLELVNENAEVNQNAFSNIKIGNTTIAADAKQDTVELIGSNVTLTPDAINDKVTIGITATNVTDALGYTPPTTNTTYSVATSSTDGLMSKDDKAAFDSGISIANNAVEIGGSISADTLRTSLGLNNALHFLGITTTSMSDDRTSATVSIGGNNVTAVAGDVVISDDTHYEYVWVPTGTSTGRWERLGPDGSYALSGHTHDEVSSSAAGFMSVSDKGKLDLIESGANYVSISADSPLSASAATGAVTISHDNSGVSANTYGVTATTALTPGFGNTFSVPGFTVNAKGHITAAGAHTVKIPNTEASTSSPGLMSADDKGKLDLIESNANNYVHPTTTAVTAGAYKVGNDSSGHVVLGNTLVPSDIGAATDDHVHGNIANDGTITSTEISLAGGDYLLVSDASNSGKIEKGISFDGTTDTTALTEAGTWREFVPTQIIGTNYTTIVQNLNTSSQQGVGLGVINNSTGNYITGIGISPFGITLQTDGGILLDSDITAEGNLVPQTDNTYDLGYPNKKWNNIYANNLYGDLTGNADTATAADLTTTTNAVAYYTNTTGTFGSKASANGALYATSANGALTFGTLPVAQGGTGLTTSTYKNAVLIGNASTATSAFRTIRTKSGAFYATAQDGAPQFGTLPVAQGGTGATSLANITVGKATADASGNTITTTYATKTELNGLIAASDAMVYKGTLDGSSTSPGTFTPAANCGDTYKVAVAGYINGQRVEIGDMLICTADSTVAATSSNYETVQGTWTIIQTNLDGALFMGTSTLTDGYLLAAQGTSGQVKSVQVTTGTVNSLSTNYDSTNERLEFITVSGMSVVTSIGDIPTLVDGNGASY